MNRCVHRFGFVAMYTLVFKKKKADVKNDNSMTIGGSPLLIRKSEEAVIGFLLEKGVCFATLWVLLLPI